MSRSIGDAVGAMVGVTAEPEVVHETLRPEDSILLVCSDGVWEFLESHDAAQLFAKTLAAQRRLDEDGLLSAATFLCERVRAHWLEEDKYVDDITALAVRFIHGKDATDARPTTTGAASPSPFHFSSSFLQPPSRMAEKIKRKMKGGGGGGRG